MPLFNNEAEQDAFLQQEDLRAAQRFNGESKFFGAWALLKSSRFAENREARALAREQRAIERKRREIEKKEQSAGRHKRSLGRIRQLGQLSRRMVTWSR